MSEKLPDWCKQPPAYFRDYRDTYLKVEVLFTKHTEETNAEAYARVARFVLEEMFLEGAAPFEPTPGVELDPEMEWTSEAGVRNCVDCEVAARAIWDIIYEFLDNSEFARARGMSSSEFDASTTSMQEEIISGFVAGIWENRGEWMENYTEEHTEEEDDDDIEED